jgi:nucleoside-diphosphate-sugar epimerase
MKILVTGATGFLGSALVGRLVARGERDVRCLVRTGSDRSRLEALARDAGDAKVELFVGSLGTTASAAKALEGVDVVYHLAASLAGAAADMFLSTVVASKHLFDAIVAAGRPIKIVLVSSFGVYGTAALPAGALVDESTPLEPHPERRDVYSHAKLRQERLFREAAERHGLPLVVLRPGVIYGPGGSRLSARVGLDLAGVFLALGGRNLLPLTYVESCADAIAIAGRSDAAVGQTFNVVDDDLLTADEYLALYRREVERLTVVPVPYLALEAVSRAVEAYSRWSKGQLPAIFTPYKTRTTWKGTRFSNANLKALGWRPLVPTSKGIERAFAFHKVAVDRAKATG